MTTLLWLSLKELGLLKTMSPGFLSLGIWFFLDILSLEDESIMFSQNAGNWIPNDAVSELIRLFASATALQELKNLYLALNPSISISLCHRCNITPNMKMT